MVKFFVSHQQFAKSVKPAVSNFDDPAKNGWQLVEALEQRDPYSIQHFLNQARWDADVVRDDVRQSVVDALGQNDGVLVIDETGFLKNGTHSAGVGRQ